MSHDCSDPITQTTFADISSPSYMGRATRDGEINSEAVAGFAEDKTYRNHVGTSATVDSAPGFRVSARLRVEDGYTEAWAAPFGGYAEASIKVTLTVSRDRDVVASDQLVLDSRNTPGFHTSRVLHRAIHELDCSGELGPDGDTLHARVIVENKATAGAIAGATARIALHVQSISFERCGARLFDAPSGMVPLVRWYSRGRTDNFTTSRPEWVGWHGAVRSPDYTFSRFEGFVYDPNAPQPPDTLPLISWWSPERRENFLTSDPRWDESRPERQDVYRRSRREGYILKNRPSDRASTPLLSWWNPDREDNYATAHPAWLEHYDEDALDIAPDGAIRNGPTVDGYRLFRREGFLLV